MEKLLIERGDDQSGRSGIVLLPVPLREVNAQLMDLLHITQTWHDPIFIILVRLFEYFNNSNQNISLLMDRRTDTKIVSVG